MIRSMQCPAKTVGFASLVFALSACGKLPGFVVDQKADLFQQIYDRNDKIDILFVVDNSGSMDNEQTVLASSFAAFISPFTSKNLKYHIGVISTDTHFANPSPPAAAGSVNWWWTVGDANLPDTYNPPSASNPAGCNNNATAGGGWIDATRPYYYFPNAGPGSLLGYRNSPLGITNDRFLTPESINITGPNGQFMKNAKIGICGAGAEAGLLAATSALSPAMLDSSTGFNKGFIRDGAALAIIMVTDEDEAVGNTNANPIAATPAAKTARINTFIDRLRTLKGNDLSKVRMDAVVVKSTSVAVGHPDYCGTAPYSGSDGLVYMEAAAALGGQSVNICSETQFTAALDQLGVDLVSLTTKFKLMQPPNGQIVVFVNGSFVPEDDNNGWSFDENTLEVEFHGTAVPPENAIISVNYIPAAPV